MNKMTKCTLMLSALLMLILLLLYVRHIHSPLIFDDLSFFLGNENRVNMQQYAEQFSLVRWRALPEATFTWQLQWLGNELSHLRIVNILLHCMTVVILFLLLINLLHCAMPDAAKFQNLKIVLVSFFAVLLYGIHPVNAYAVAYLVQRTILMSGMFCVLAIYCYQRGMANNRSIWLWGAVLFYYWAAFSKEHAIVLPFVFLALTILLYRDWIVKLRKHWLIWCGLLIIAILVLSADRNVIGTLYEPQAINLIGAEKTENIKTLSILTQGGLFFRYVFLWLFPNPEWMSIDIRVPIVQDVSTETLIPMLFYIFYGIFAVRLLLKRGLVGLAGFGMIIPWLMFFTEFSTIRVQEPFVLYRSYLWLLGLPILLATIALHMSSRVALVIFPVLSVAMFIITMERIVTFSNRVLLWEDAAKLVDKDTDSLGGSRIYNNLGMSYIEIHQYSKAIPILQKAIVISPETYFIHGNLGVAYAASERLTDALAELNLSILLRMKQYKTPDPRQHYARADVHEKMGNRQAARADYSITCKEDKIGCEKLTMLSDTVR